MKKWNPESIKELRKKMKLSQKAFGEMLGISRNYIYYLESGLKESGKTLCLLLDCIERELKTKGGEKNGKRDLQKR
jgi:transcriptional regulator with XRE-family HTH domain